MPTEKVTDTSRNYKYNKFEIWDIFLCCQSFIYVHSFKCSQKTKEEQNHIYFSLETVQFKKLYTAKMKTLSPNLDFYYM